MQVLYQLSYGPIGTLGETQALLCAHRAYTAGVHPVPLCHTCRQTATSFPWISTWSAESSIGA